MSWVDVFTLRDYQDIVVESLKSGQKEKDLSPSSGFGAALPFATV